MPAKKKAKKGKVKKKASAKKEVEEGEEKPIYDFPEYEDPYLVTPRANLKISLINPPMIRKLSFTVEVMITARVEEIRQMIIDKHGGAIQDVKIYLGPNIDVKDHLALDPMKTLEEQGVVAEGDYIIGYDYAPISHPLLTTHMSYI